MIGRGGLETSGSQPGPQSVLVMPGAERRAHDISGGRLPIGVPVDGLVDHEMLGEDLAEDAVAGCPGAGDGLGGLFGRDMDDIDRRSQHIGDGDGALGCLAFLTAGGTCKPGPVILELCFFWRWKTASPFSAWTVHSAPSSCARAKLFSRMPSSTMMAPL